MVSDSDFLPLILALSSYLLHENAIKDSGIIFIEHTDSCHVYQLIQMDIRNKFV